MSLCETIRLDLLDILGSGYVIDHCVSAIIKKNKEKLYQKYIAESFKNVNDNIASIASALSKGKADVKSVISFDELEKRIKNKTKKKEKTGDEIAEEVIERLCKKVVKS